MSCAATIPVFVASLLARTLRNWRVGWSDRPANDFDTVALRQISSDRGLRDIGLTVHGAGDRARKRIRYKHHDPSSRLVAIPEIRRQENRTYEDDGRQQLRLLEHQSAWTLFVKRT